MSTTEDPIAAIRKRVAAWGREDSRILLAEIDRVAAENTRLRAALGAYADRARWQTVAYPLANGNLGLASIFDGGWGVADAALAGEG